MVGDPVVCLGCGGLVGRDDAWGCKCPPPTFVQSGVHPYRSGVVHDACPRCAGRLSEEVYHDVVCPTCSGCGGLFVPRDVLLRLGEEGAASLRLAFPRRSADAAAQPVRYLPCIVCKKLMNRTIFAHVSGVLVDVCKADGVWFDAGEIGKTLAFIEDGGLGRGAAFEQKRAREAATADRKAWEKAREPVMTGLSWYDHEAEGREGRLLVEALRSLFR